MRNPFLKFWYNCIRLAPPKSEQVYEIISRTCESVDAICTQNLIADIINDLEEISGGQIYLPSLQIVCYQLFDYVHSKETKIHLGFDDYRTLGSSVGIIERFYDTKLWQAIPDEERPIAAELLMTLTGSHGARLFRTWNEICNEVNENPKILERLREVLVNMRVIKTVASGEAEGYELTHDCLARRIAEGMDNEVRDIKMFRELMKTCIQEWGLYRMLASRDRLEIFIRHLHDLALDKEEVQMLLASFFRVGWIDNPWLISLSLKDILSESVTLLAENDDEIKLFTVEGISQVINQRSKEWDILEPDILEVFSQALISLVNEKSHGKLLEHITLLLIKLGYRNLTLRRILQLPLAEFEKFSLWKSRVELLQYFVVEDQTTMEVLFHLYNNCPTEKHKEVIRICLLPLLHSIHLEGSKREQILKRFDMHPIAYGFSTVGDGLFGASWIKGEHSLPEVIGYDKIPNTPTNRDKLRDIISTALCSTTRNGYEKYKADLPAESIVGILVPHMHFTNNKSPLTACITASHGYRILAANYHPERFILLCPDHTGLGSTEFSICSPEWSWVTLLGKIETDIELVSELCSTSYFKVDERPFQVETGFHPHLAPLQYLFGSFSVVPIIIRVSELETLLCIGRTIGQIIKDKFPRTCLVSVSDLIHYEPPANSIRKIEPVITAIEKMDPVELRKVVDNHNITMDGDCPTIVAIEAARFLGATKGIMLDFGYTFFGEYSVGGELIGNRNNISHVAFAFLRA